MTSKSDLYEGLEPKYIEIAKKELKEDPKKVSAHIASLRNWLQQSRHIQNFPDDDASLLRFLRIAKFNHEAAQARLENVATIRGSELRGLPYAFKFPSLEDPIVQRLIELGFHLPCGFNERGDSVMIINFRSWNPDEISWKDMLSFMSLGLEVIFSDQRCQIAGLTSIIDLEGITKKHIDNMLSDRKAVKDLVRIFQDGSPMRNREVYHYKEPLIFDLVFSLMKLWIKPKLLRRVHNVNDGKKLIDKMPGAKQILPKEYGGDNGTLAELREKWRQQVVEFVSKPNPMSNIKVDESLRPVDSLKFLKDYKDIPDEVYGTRGTFTKVHAE